MSQSGIYKIQSISHSERCYIGSSFAINERWKIHLIYLRRGDHHSPKLQNHYNKYGENDLEFIIVEPCMPDWLVIREQYYIDTLKPWFNICPKAGSARGVKRSKEFCENLSRRMKGKRYMLGKKMSEESKLKVSKSNKGKRLGIKQSPESIAKGVAKRKGRIPPQSERDNISKALKGRIKSKEECKNISNGLLKSGHRPPSRLGIKHTEATKFKMSKDRVCWNKGIPCTEEAKKNQSLKMKGKLAGEKNPNYGKHLTPEQKIRMSEYVKAGLLRKKGYENVNLKIA